MGAAVCLAVPMVDAADSLTMADFAYTNKLMVAGYTGTETLTNFPVLVEVRKKDTNGFSYDDFYHAGGRDIAFVDEKGHVIPHEIDTWNPNGMSLIWVRLPEMNNGTKFTMCYRSPLVNPPIGDYAAGTPEYNFIVEIGNVAWDESSGTASWVETIAKSESVSYTWLYEANHIGATFDLNPPPGKAWTPTAFTETPEPSSGLLLLIGGALLALRRRGSDVKA